MEYNILYHSSMSLLQHTVQGSCAEGWEPIGGVSFDGVRYLQAVYKPNAKKAPPKKKSGRAGGTKV